MNRDIVEGRWKQLKGRAKVRWSHLTGDHFGVIAGKREQTAGRLQVVVGEGARNIGKRFRRLGVRSKT